MVFGRFWFLVPYQVPGLPTQFTSISKVLTSPPECSENHIFTKLAQEPDFLLPENRPKRGRTPWMLEIEKILILSDINV